MAHVLHLNIDEEAGGEADGGAAGVFLAVDVEAAGADFRAFFDLDGDDVEVFGDFLRHGHGIQMKFLLDFDQGRWRARQLARVYGTIFMAGNIDFSRLTGAYAPAKFEVLR